MTNVYAGEWDWDGDRCECGQLIATHDPIEAPKPIELGRVGGETKPFSREWRSQPYDAPDEPRAPQQEQPPRRGTGHRPDTALDAAVIEAIRAQPDGNYVTVAAAVGKKPTAVLTRVKRLERDGQLPADCVEWKKRRTRSRQKWDLGRW